MIWQYIINLESVFTWLISWIFSKSIPDTLEVSGKLECILWFMYIWVEFDKLLYTPCTPLYNMAGLGGSGTKVVFKF